MKDLGHAKKLGSKPIQNYILVDILVDGQEREQRRATTQLGSKPIQN